MSKTYDALLKAQREHTRPKKQSVLSKSPPEKQKVSDSVQKREEKTSSLPLSTVPVHEEEFSRPPTDRGRLTSCVIIGSLVAKANSIRAEQFRKLRNLITTQKLANSLRSVLITSSLSGEGKTMVALNLSKTIAQGRDDSVILVDADLRRSNLTSLLGLQNTAGLVDILEGTATIEETLLDTEIEGLTILPGGVNPSNHAELIASNRMNKALQQLKGKYKDSYIIIDSTPIVSTSEPQALSQIVDGIILVVMADKTRRDIVRNELQTINREKILGVVLNCAEFEASDYYHKYLKEYGK